ncbi:uncharacterized membrane protein (DUF441 family) [Acinetobacter calcoaceticus]|uniref:UPF0756 membrane protein EC844_12010 n=1 Tax=Acinetobacter calcoaceticus TaxID=471 RepID=A0A4R1XJX4_ACICA|nr:uncharacterized membrane protein (DUF441 family) [Acinetobacter calcoaceticus]
MPPYLFKMTCIVMSLSNLDLNLIVLIVLLACGVLSHNSSITIAAAVLIIFRITPLSEYFPYLQNYGLHIGIIILTIGVLTPIASGKLPGEAILKSFLSWKSLLAIGIGLAVAWLGGRGVKLMSNQPDVVAGLLIGTVAGVAVLRGVPVGPLIAAGLLSLLIGIKPG